MAEAMHIPVLGIVENYSYLKCPDCGKKISVFGESHIDGCRRAWRSGTGKMPIYPVLAEAVESEKFYESDNQYLSGAVNKL